jgi:hypothetical protein
VQDGQADLDLARAIGDFEAAMDDDLDTPVALGVLSGLAEQVLATPSTDGRRTLQELCSVFGIETP